MTAKLLGAIGLSIALGAGSVLAFDNCSPTVHIVYDGATAVAVSINQAAQNLYGAPMSDCGSNIKTYQALRDLDGDGTKETCVRFYFGQGRGSCEGVQELDIKDGGFDVCQPVSGSTTKVKANTLKDELNAFLYANYSASDVAAEVCAPVITGGLTRPDIFTNTQSQLFVNPFIMIINKGMRNNLPASRVTAPPSASNCPSGFTDCPRVDFGVNREQLKGIFGNNNYCDWRQIDTGVSSTANPFIIGAVHRNRLSGTRRTFDVNVLETLGMGQGVIYETGTGNVVSRVGTNDWCGTKPAECGENSSGVIGGQTSPCQTLGTSAISTGMIGADRTKIVDPNTPTNPFDDYAVRLNSGDNYDVLRFNNAYFNKPNVRCGQYALWSFENSYFDEAYHTPGSAREAAVKELNNRAISDAVNDDNVVALSQMFFSRSRDGAPIFPKSAYNSFCTAP